MDFQQVIELVWQLIVLQFQLILAGILAIIVLVVLYATWAVLKTLIVNPIIDSLT